MGAVRHREICFTWALPDSLIECELTLPDSTWTDASVSRTKLFWTLQLIAWMVVVFVAVIYGARTYMDFSQALLVSMLRTVIGLALSSVMALVYHYLRRRGTRLRLNVLYAVALCLLMASIDIALTRQFGLWLGVDMQNELLTAYLRNSLATRWLLYMFWSGTYFWMNYWLDTQQIQLALARAEAAAHTSELKALKAQINPHFLFNALSSILAESGDNQKLRTLTLSLSDYLRFLLQQHKDTATLSHELDALESYLQVEKARFEDNLEYAIEADEQARNAVVPTSLVQPLLENAIKYGQRTSPRPLQVSIRATIEKGKVLLRVRNSGKWVPPENNQSTKTGLANLRRRLELVYHGDATLNIITDDSNVTIEVVIPWRTAGDLT